MAAIEPTMSDGLAAVTATPGMAAPDSSATFPRRCAFAALCADADDARRSEVTAATSAIESRICMVSSGLEPHRHREASDPGVHDPGRPSAGAAFEKRRADRVAPERLQL